LPIKGKLHQENAIEKYAKNQIFGFHM